MVADWSLTCNTTASRQPVSFSVRTSASFAPQSMPGTGSIFCCAPRQPRFSSKRISPCVNTRRAITCSFGLSVGANRKAAFVELLLAVALENFATHFLGEVFGIELVRPLRAHRDVQGLLLRLVRLFLLDRAGDDHLVDHPVRQARDRSGLLAERMIVVRALRERREISDLLNGELMNRLVEIKERRGGDAVGAETEINVVQIKFENFFLRIERA